MDPQRRPSWSPFFNAECAVAAHSRPTLCFRTQNRQSAYVTETPEDMNSPLGTVIIYARDMKKTAAFYSQHFGLETTGEVVEGLIELRTTNGGAAILIHQAAKSVKLGQVGVKLSFHVPDVAAFAAVAEQNGLIFGAIHEANGYQFANAKDPDQNSVCISSRAFRAGITR